MAVSNVTVRYFVEIRELQTKLSVFEARGVANFGTQCTCHRIVCMDAARNMKVFNSKS